MRRVYDWFVCWRRQCPIRPSWYRLRLLRQKFRLCKFRWYKFRAYKFRVYTFRVYTFRLLLRGGSLPGDRRRSRLGSLTPLLSPLPSDTPRGGPLDSAFRSGRTDSLAAG